MNNIHRTLILFLAFGGVPALVACGSRSTTVTETGNPPFVDRGRIGVDLEAGEASVRGEAGAVPGGASVRVENERTGESKRTTADADGSFEVTIEAEPGDAIGVEVDGEAESRVELTARSGAGDDSGSEAEATDETEGDGDTTEAGDTGAADDGSDQEPLTCEQRSEALRVAHAELVDGVDRACTQDSDCVSVQTNYECYSWACPLHVAISLQGQTQVDARVLEVEGQCTDLQMADCPSQITPCPLPPMEAAVCSAGQCQFASAPVEVDCGEASQDLGALQSGFWDDVDVSCEQDTDCAVAPVDPSCGTGRWRAVASESVAALATREEEVAEVCSRFATCPVSPQIPSVVPSSAICTAGSCEPVGGTCDELGRGATLALEDAVAQAQSACDSDADCQLDTAVVSCLVTCDPQTAIATDNAAALDARLAELEALLCGAFTQGNCSLPDVACAEAPAYQAACVQNRCAAVEVGPADSCETLTEQAGTELRQFVEASAKQCSADDDCMLTTLSTACYSECAESAVASASLDAIEAKVQELDAGVCGDALAADCAPVTGPCPPPIVLFPNGVGCVDGLCGAKP